MREIAVLSDIHGNYNAFERCVSYILERGIQTFIFLGGYLGEMPYPQKTMKLLYELRDSYECYFIRGNKENYWLNYDFSWKEKSSVTGALYYAYHSLTAGDLGFFKSMPIKRELVFDGMPALTICHGSPRKVNEEMRPDDENTFSIMEQNTADLIMCGHTHRQGIIRHGGKTVINASSVGLSINGGAKAQFAILSGKNGAWENELISLEYDTDAVIADLHSSRLYESAPVWCRITECMLRGGRLGGGGLTHGKVLLRAMELCEKGEGVCCWPDIPEKYMEAAMEEMIG